MVSAIPTADFSSLNLAQAVAIHCYELYQNIVFAPHATKPGKTLATSFELESMYQYMEQALWQINFLDDEERPRWMANIRNFLGRQALESKDTNLIRSICKKFLLHETGSYEIDEKNLQDQSASRKD